MMLSEYQRSKLLLKIEKIFKELDEKTYFKKADYFRTKHKFDCGYAADLGFVCNKLQLFLFEES